MKKVQVSIADENTLILQEDGSTGDIIDLTRLHETDIDKTTIESVVNSIKKDKFNEELRKETEYIKQKTILEAKLREQEVAGEAKELIAAKDHELSELKARLESADTEQKLAVSQAVAEAEKQRSRLELQLKSQEADAQRSEASLRDQYSKEIALKDEMLERYKDIRAKLSTKLVGDTLEMHCQNEFNGVRASMFPYAYFEKDNEALKEFDEDKATKGDYIYRDYDRPDGVEIVSIMFDMKNEEEASTNKKTVESHLAKLDKDRKNKGCEYAVLVTLLEADNEFYNRGIVNVSYEYEKMYVIRPQFFLPLILLLKDANLKSVESKRQLAIAQNQNIDVTNFEQDLQNFQDDFMNNVRNSGRKFQEAMKDIDDAIKKLEATKEALRLTNKHLLTAGNKVENITVKRLTKNNPTMRTTFNVLNKQ